MPKRSRALRKAEKDSLRKENSPKLQQELKHPDDIPFTVPIKPLATSVAKSTESCPNCAKGVLWLLSDQNIKKCGDCGSKFTII